MIIFDVGINSDLPLRVVTVIIGFKIQIELTDTPLHGQYSKEQCATVRKEAVKEEEKTILLEMGM